MLCPCKLKIVLTFCLAIIFISIINSIADDLPEVSMATMQPIPIEDTCLYYKLSIDTALINEITEAGDSIRYIHFSMKDCTPDSIYGLCFFFILDTSVIHVDDISITENWPNAVIRWYYKDAKHIYVELSCNFTISTLLPSSTSFVEYATIKYHISGTGGSNDKPIHLMSHRDMTSIAYRINEVSYYTTYPPCHNLLWDDIPPVICGDIDGNQVINLLDISTMISYLYREIPVICPCALNVNHSKDAKVNLLDVSYLLKNLYYGGPSPLCE